MHACILTGVILAQGASDSWGTGAYERPSLELASSSILTRIGRAAFND